MDSNSNQHIVHSGWLMKSPPEKRIWKTKWRRRWFVLKLSGQIPGQYVLEYFVDQTCKKLKGTIDLDQCEQVDAGLQLEIRKENYEHMFDLRTTKRVYYLVAKNEEEMNKWVEYICAVCGLQMENLPNEMSLLPTVELNEERYSPQPSQSEQQQQQSTSESSLSTLNYIPISECYTGKPQSPPPPRPPKPIGLQLSKSQSSLALWPYDQPDPQSKPVVTPAALKVLPTAVLVNDRPLYLNSSLPSGQILNSHNKYDTWHSSSMKMAPNNDPINLFPPPQVNRDLKPQRRRNMDPNATYVLPRISSLNNHMSLSRHTLPRPPPVSSGYSFRGDDMSPNNKTPFSHLFPSEQNKSVPHPIGMGKPIDNNMNEIQYLDLDLDSESTNSQSPRTPLDNTSGHLDTTNATLHSGWNIPPSSNHSRISSNLQSDLLNNNSLTNSNGSIHSSSIINNNSNLTINSNNNNNLANSNNNNINNNQHSTVYKKVDFVKTEALNKMRLKVDLYRNSN